jgi:UDP-N-acetylbacillosamine transaminase
MDPNLLEYAIKKLDKKGKKPKAVIVVHLYGQPADIEAIAEICNKYDIFLIEDAAESLGATFKGKHTGTFGDFGIFSFNGNKIITTSGGGALISGNEKYIEKAKFLSTQAKEDFIWYEHKELGFNYRMSNVLAAIGLGQMETLDKKVSKKRTVFEKYREELSNAGEVKFMPEIDGAHGSRWLSALTFEQTSPLKIIENLAANEIEARPLWKPMHLQPLFKDSLSFVNGVSEQLFKKGVCLPSGSSLSDENLNEITSIIKQTIVR